MVFLSLAGVTAHMISDYWWHFVDCAGATNVVYVPAYTWAGTRELVIYLRSLGHTWLLLVDIHLAGANPANATTEFFYPGKIGGATPLWPITIDSTSRPGTVGLTLTLSLILHRPRTPVQGGGLHAHGGHSARHTGASRELAEPPTDGEDPPHDRSPLGHGHLGWTRCART